MRGDVHAHRDAANIPKNLVRIYCSNSTSHCASHIHEGTHTSLISGCNSHYLYPADIRDPDTSKGQSLETSLLQSIHVTMNKPGDSRQDNRLSDGNLLSIKDQFDQVPDIFREGSLQPDFISFRENCVTMKTTQPDHSDVKFSNVVIANHQEPHWGHDGLEPHFYQTVSATKHYKKRQSPGFSLPSDHNDKEAMDFLVVTADMKSSINVKHHLDKFPVSIPNNLKDRIKLEFEYLLSQADVVQIRSKKKQPHVAETQSEKAALLEPMISQKQQEHAVQFFSENDECSEEENEDGHDDGYKDAKYLKQQGSRATPLKSSLKKSRYNTSESRNNQSSLQQSPLSIHKTDYKAITSEREVTSIDFQHISQKNADTSEVYSKICKYAQRSFKPRKPIETGHARTISIEDQQATSRFGTTVDHDCSLPAHCSKESNYKCWKSKSRGCQGIEKMIDKVSQTSMTPHRQRLVNYCPGKQLTESEGQGQHKNYFVNYRFERPESAFTKVSKTFSIQPLKVVSRLEHKDRHITLQDRSGSKQGHFSHLSKSYLKKTQNTQFMSGSKLSESHSRLGGDIVSMNLATGQLTRNIMRATFQL